MKRTKLKLIPTFFFLLLVQGYYMNGFGKDKNDYEANTDSTSSEGIIFIKLGYFPYYNKIQSDGIFGSISNNGDFRNIIDFGWYVSFYGGLDASKNESGLLFGGFNLGHKFNLGNRYLIINLVTGLAFSGTYPGIANVLEINYPLLFLFERSAIDFSFSCGLLRFTTLMPVTFSLSYSF